MPKKIIIIGGGAHAYSLLDLLEQQGESVVAGYVDEQPTDLVATYLGTDEQFLQSRKFSPDEVNLVMGIGINMHIRSKVYCKYKEHGFSFLSVMHQTAFINGSAEIGEGSVIFPMAMIGPGVRIGKNVVVHSQSVVEHRTIIGDHSYLSPSVTVCGDSSLGSKNFVGVRASIAQGLKLAENVTVGAGAIVLKSFTQPGALLIGTPAKEAVQV